ncbi:mycofactocin-coupled SDR family oxidoreductase [[Mycobacterium] wendilense]|uniref:Mycofactocin-coupled SDR family oxidoreductase n=1 Tax=[Mycobacterium] wendilense TaxID=3064284 RepID=A0ABM9MII6_9MYCO|nr:mycofactocin-coupled SDR family oxidoreductase [Mycolicibacterium sp. MU0050]CAJ1586042.1 mycofactocin-coupled SDR family oxidoreductase [Mycolicibacterium sp. MU0050]
MSTQRSGVAAGKVAFITGAARGQGRSHAIRLAQEGADIIAVDICAPIPTVPYPLADPADLDETVRLVESAGGRILFRAGDVRDFDFLRETVDAGVKEFGRLDIVLGNAGIAHYSSALDLDAQSWSDMIDVNLNGVWWTVKAALPHLVAGQRGGSIILTSSTAGLRGMEHCVHYAAAKHGLVGMMKVLALELGRHRIRVNAIHPNSTNTDMLQNEPTYGLFLPGRENPTMEDFSRIAQRLNVLPVPWSEPSDISDAILFLISDQACNITGVSLPVDAGQSIRW